MRETRGVTGRDGARGSRRPYIVVGVVTAAAVIAIVYSTRFLGKAFAQRRAFQRLAAGDLGLAEWWLGRAAWFDSRDCNTLLLQASLHRQRRLRDAWEASLEAARSQGLPERSLALERQLARYQWGKLDQAEERQAGRLVSAGASPADVATVFLRGYLAQRNAVRAKAFLEELPAGVPEAHVDFLWGLYWRSRGDRVEAENRLHRALERQSGHEMARMELAALLLDMRQFDEALREYALVAARSPGNDAARMGLARVLRFQARLDEARAVLAPLAARPKPTDSVVLETAWIELESGNAEEAERWFRQVPFAEASFDDMCSAMLITRSLRGKGVEASRLYDKSAARDRRQERSTEFRSAIARISNDLAPAAEFPRPEQEQLSASFADAFGPAPLEPTTRGGSPSEAGELFARHCAVCHGDTGNGHGRASRHLYPRPRDLRNGRSALVGTINAVPSREDLEKVLVNGMPGTSMPAFPELTQSQRSVLAGEVLRLRREGVREQVLRALQEDEGEAVDYAEVQHAVEVSTVPGSHITVPTRWPGPEKAAALMARGGGSYRSLGCNKCHGDDGTGTGGETLFDERGEPVLARDLVRDPFKGGRDPQSIYLRLVAGMPGTPHPAVSNLDEAELIALTEFVRSLEQGERRTRTNFERRASADAHAGTLAKRLEATGG